MTPVPETSPAVVSERRGRQPDAPATGSDDTPVGTLRRGDPLDLRDVRSVLARALRLMTTHVRCTCTMRDGGHARDCHRVRSLAVLADAERLGVGLTWGMQEDATVPLTEHYAGELKRRHYGE